MYLVYFCSLIVTVISQSTSCDYGNFTTDPTTSQCMFNCENAGTYVDISTLSFDFIAEQCNDVGDAAKIGLCSELNDLEFPITTCGCPRCPCTTKDLVTIDSFEQVLQKECYTCTCGDDPTYSPLVLQCAQLYSVSSPYNWNDFTCQYPAISCTDSVSSTTYYPGQGWFAANSDSSPCETYCYCNPDGSMPCETGFENIVNSADSGLIAAFKDICGQDIDSCTNDPSRMTSRYTGSCGRSSCPYCDCGTRVLGDQWHSEYSKTSSLTTCALCSCESSNVTECGDEETYASGSSSTCPGPNTLSCHDGYGWGTDSKLAADQVLNPVECATNFPDVWCSWQFQAGETIDNEYWDWRCDTSPFCGTYGSNDACFYGEYTVSYTDCDGVVQTQTEKQYTYCCNTADCNLKDVDITACKENTQFSSLMENLFSCVYGSLYVLYHGCDTFISETTTCTAVEEMYGSLFDCYCNSYGRILYQDAPTEWQVFLEEQMDVLRDQVYDSDWNDALPCDINLQCDLTATETPVTTTHSVDVITTQSVDATTPTQDPTQIPTKYPTSETTPTPTQWNHVIVITDRVLVAIVIVVSIVSILGIGIGVSCCIHYNKQKKKSEETTVHITMTTGARDQTVDDIKNERKSNVVNVVKAHEYDSMEDIVEDMHGVNKCDDNTGVTSDDAESESHESMYVVQRQSTKTKTGNAEDNDGRKNGEGFGTFGYEDEGVRNEE